MIAWIAPVVSGAECVAYREEAPKLDSHGAMGKDGFYTFVLSGDYVIRENKSGRWMRVSVVSGERLRLTEALGRGCGMFYQAALKAVRK